VVLGRSAGIRMFFTVVKNIAHARARLRASAQNGHLKPKKLATSLRLKPHCPPCRYESPGRPLATSGDMGRGNGGANVASEPEATEDPGPSIDFRYKGRRATPAKRASGKKATKAAPKRAVKLMLEDEVYEVLAVHGIRRKLNLSALVSALVREHLTDWSVHARPGSKGGSGSEPPSAGSESAAA
jgi:hypothetical protein